MDQQHKNPSVNKRPEGYWRIPDLLDKVVSVEVLQQLDEFYLELMKFNKKLNLISRRTELDADIMHIYDAYWGGQELLSRVSAEVLYDIGSGNGLPGLVMAILDKNRMFVLVDSDERKIEFLKHVISKLNLSHVTTLRARFEDLPADSISCAVSRGFASLSKALLVGRTSIRQGGEYYHFKGSGWSREIAEIPSQLCSIWSPQLISEYDLPFLSVKMALVVAHKIA